MSDSNMDNELDDLVLDPDDLNNYPKEEVSAAF